MPNRSRCTAAAIALFLVSALPVSAQDPKPHLALTGGLGNVLGGLGAAVEYYLAGSRISASGGVGFLAAGGLREGGFFGGGAVGGVFGGRGDRGILPVFFSLLLGLCAAFW